MAICVLKQPFPSLQDNPLGDAVERELHLIVPDDLEPGEAVPCIWYLAGYAGVGRSMLAGDPWQEGLEDRLKRLRAEGKIGKLILALPDAFTMLGGAQYLNSPAIGRYRDYLSEDLPELVEAHYAISQHGIAGKSSGGYGALRHGIWRPDRFVAVACSSGDMLFELSLLKDLPVLMNAIRDHGSLEAMWEAFVQSPNKKSGRWFGPMSVLAMAAAYSPNAEAPLGIDLPFDLSTGALRPEVFARWLAQDPVRLVDEPEVQDALSALKLLYIDCGDHDEHALHWGALLLHSKLEAAGVPHRYESFKGGHRQTSHRLDVFLPLLDSALAIPARLGGFGLLCGAGERAQPEPAKVARQGLGDLGERQLLVGQPVPADVTRHAPDDAAGLILHPKGRPLRGQKLGAGEAVFAHAGQNQAHGAFSGGFGGRSKQDIHRGPAGVFGRSIGEPGHVAPLRIASELEVTIARRHAHHAGF